MTAINKLSDTKVKNAKSKRAPYKLSDGDGLFLLVTPTGGKWWRIAYRLGGKQKLLSLGTYPAISLSMVRERRAETRRLITNGVDPSEYRKVRRDDGDGTFGAVARVLAPTEN
ncbi:MAG: DUF4102 domain-containing protein [Gammaproteobacteria bacterium]|nr:DUF4102 domain-containing protein [Gammaproteobacteria bacterium]